MSNRSSTEEKVERSPRRRGRWVIALPLGVMAISIFAIWSALRAQGISAAFANGFQPPEMAAAQFASQDVVGDLGGIPVTIPRHFANYAEYDGDPGFGEKRKEPRPERTHQSRLRSFGFDVRYPDLTGTSSAALWLERQNASIYDTPWISAGVRSGDRYPGDGFLDRLFDSLHDPAPRPPFQYGERLPQTQYGLVVYAPVGIDPQTDRPSRESRISKDVFVHRGKNGKVDAYIDCGNNLEGVASCSQEFSLEPYADADISVQYRRDLLSEWQQIQTSVTQLILGFKTAESTPPMPSR